MLEAVILSKKKKKKKMQRRNECLEFRENSQKLIIKLLFNMDTPTKRLSPLFYFHKWRIRTD